MTWNDRFVWFWWKGYCFPVFAKSLGQCDDFENFDAQTCHLDETCSAWPKKSVFYNCHEKRTVFPFSREFEATFTILRTLTLLNAIWLKRAPHDLKTAFCTIFLESAMFSRFEENSRLASRFWELWRSKMRFGQNVLRMTWKKEFCTIFMKSSLFSRFCKNFRPVWRFWELYRSKLRFGQNVLRMTWRSVLYNFHEKRAVFPSWREFEPSFTILRTLTLQNAIWPKRAPRDLKERFIQFSWKARCFPVFKRICSQFDDFENFNAQKCDLAKTCCDWPEKSVLQNFYKKRTVFPF